MHGFNEIQQFLQMLLNINETHISPLLKSHNAQEGLKLSAASLEVATFSFLEINDMPNGIKVLRDPSLSEKIKDNLL